MFNCNFEIESYNGIYIVKKKDIEIKIDEKEIELKFAKPFEKRKKIGKLIEWIETTTKLYSGMVVPPSKNLKYYSY